MNTPKYQQGGGFESLFTIYKPIQTETPRRAAAPSRRSESREKDDSDKGKLTEKELFSMLKDLDGLPNEMQQLVSNLTNTLRIAKVTGQDDINDLATTYLTNLYKLKQAKYNRDLFKETYDRAVENNSLNDIAITLNGSVLALDKDQKIVSMRPEEWVQAKQSGEYQALTNSNLLWYRSQHPEYVNNNKVLQIVENGIGLESVHKMIKDRFRELGSTETGSETFIPKEAAKGQQIIEQMLQYGPEGYYKISAELTQTDQRQVDATLAYIYSTLPANARTRLALETSDGTQKSAQSIIGAMIFGTLDSKTKYSAQYVGTDEKLLGKDKKGNSTMDINIATKFLQGYGDSEAFSINLGNDRSIIVQANTLPLVSKSDQPLGVNQPLSKISEGSYNGILNFESVSIGMSVVDPSMLNQVIVSDGKVRSIDFPCINDRGRILPDLSPDTATKKDQAELALKQRGINPDNPEHRKRYYREINQEYVNHQLQAPYDENGNVANGTWARFAIMNISTDERVLGKNSQKIGLDEITDDFEADNLISIIKENVKDYESTRNDWFGADALYKGVAWIPIRSSYNAAMATENISRAEAASLHQADQALQTQSQYVTPPQLP